MKLKGTAKLESQHHFTTLRESQFTQFEILPIQENVTHWPHRDLNPGPLAPFANALTTRLLLKERATDKNIRL